MTTEADALRRQFMAAGFDARDALPQPLDQFQSWLAEARAAGLRLAHAMTLATVDSAGRPSARLVLMTSCDANGLVYYTDAGSAKAAATDHNPHAAAVFHWAGLERQVRVEGQVVQVTDAEADAHWATRGWLPRVAAWAGRQSQVVVNRAELEEKLLAHMAQYDGADPPRPPYYRGYRLSPALVEFWQGRDDWLHDRVRYRRLEGGGWLIERLAP